VIKQPASTDDTIASFKPRPERSTASPAISRRDGELSFGELHNGTGYVCSAASQTCRTSTDLRHKTMHSPACKAVERQLCELGQEHMNYSPFHRQSKSGVIKCVGQERAVSASAAGSNFAIRSGLERGNAAAAGRGRRRPRSGRHGVRLWWPVRLARF
jgi:hypothetical protein